VISKIYFHRVTVSERGNSLNCCRYWEQAQTATQCGDLSLRAHAFLEKFTQ